MKTYDALENYLFEISINQQLAKATVSSYENQLKKYMEFLTSIDVFEMEEISHDLILDYIDEITDNLASSSVAHAISSIRNFHLYISSTYPKIINPTVKIKLKKESLNLPNLISNEDLDLIFSSFTDSDIDIFHQVLLEFLYSCGLRVSELCNLFQNDINIENKILRVKGKGDKTRFVPISDEALFRLKQYLPLRMKYNTNNYQNIFINKHGNKVTRQYVYQILKNICNQEGILKHYSPHSFRHTYATHLLDGGADLRHVQELLGHSDISTTQIYVHLQSKQLINAYDKFFKR